MAFKYHNTDLQYLAQEQTFRSDINFIIYDILASQEDYYRFDDLFEVVYNDNVDINELDVFEYAEISNVSSNNDISPVRLNMSDKNEFNENYFKKIEKGDIIKVQKNDILISKVRPYLKKIIFIDSSNCHIYFTSAFIHIRPRKHPHLLFYLLKGHFTNYINSVSRQGKGYPTLSDKDLFFMKFSKNYIDNALAKENDILSQTIIIEEKIKELQNKIIPFSLIVDSVFEEEYMIKKQNIIRDYMPMYSCAINRISNSYDFRSSFRFNSHKYNYLNEAIFKDHTFKEVIDVQFTTLGRQLSPKDIMEESDVYYINTNSIKISGFDETVLTPISDTFFNDNKKIKVAKNDILLIASGEGSIGKTTIFNSDKDCITSQFVMKLHPKKGTNIDYILYYMQSFLFQFVVEKFKKGKGNMTNIYASQLVNFPILLPSKERQIRIAHKINESITKQNYYNKKIETLRMQIDDIIYNAI